MMKSFFKKLSLVMALAMVVTLMAPAASALADEAGIALQGTKKVVTEYSVDVGEEVVDFCFLGAPADWKTTFAWTSDDEDVATVDKAGKVTAYKDGVANITITAGADKSYKHTVKVTVGKGEVNLDAFTAKQTSHITFDVNFNKTVSYKREDVNLYRVFNTDKGDVYVVWAVRSAKLSDDGKTLSVEPYVQFNDGERYLVAFQDIETKLNNGSSLEGIEYAEFVTRIGEIDNVKVTYKSIVDGVDTPYVAYTNGEDAEEDIEVVLDYKLYSGDIDLTAIYKNEGYVEFLLENEEQVAEYVVLSENTLVFTKEYIPAQVKAQYVFENAEGEEKIASSKTETIISQLLPKFAISYVKEWSFVNDENWSWSNPDHDLRAGKKATIALLLVDNRGGEWETVNKDSRILDFGANDSNTEDMYLRFYSTDNDHFLVDDETGEVETYMKMKKAVVYVALHDEALLEEYDSDFVRNIGACVMEIQDPAEFSGVGIYDGNNKKSSVTLVTNAVVDPANTGRFVEELTTDVFSIKAVDQDGATYNTATDPVLKNTTIKYTLTTTNKDIRELMGDDDWGVPGLGIIGNQLEIDAVALNDITDSSTISVTITATQYDEKGKKLNEERASFKVYLRDPELFDADDEIPGAWTIGDVKPTSWGLEVTGVGLMPKGGKSTAKIKIPMLSKSYTVGYYNRYDMSTAASGSAITIVEDTKAYEFGKADGKIQEEGIFVLVIGPDGKAVKAATNGGLGVYVDQANYFTGVNVTADDNGDGDVDYLATGDYTVKVTFVTDVKHDAAGKVTDVTYKTRYTKFTVTDDRDAVQFVDMNEVESELTVGDVDDFDSIVEIIQQNYKFKYDIANDGKIVEFVPSEAQIRDVDCIVKGNYITIKSITFQIQTGNDYYVTTTKGINRAVKFGVTE